MRRWLPYPLLSAFLLGMWLLLNQTLWPGHVLLGAALGLGGGLALAGLQPRPRKRSIGEMFAGSRAALVLASLVLTDIVRSNIAVARLVLRRGTRGATSGFVSIPLELRHPGGLAVLACIVTATPGTSWARYEAASGVLTIHVLDLIDESEWIDTIRQRYGRRLMEIFE